MLVIVHAKVVFTLFFLTLYATKILFRCLTQIVGLEEYREGAMGHLIRNRMEGRVGSCFSALFSERWVGIATMLYIPRATHDVEGDVRT